MELVAALVVRKNNSSSSPEFQVWLFGRVSRLGLKTTSSSQNLKAFRNVEHRLEGNGLVTATVSSQPAFVNRSW